MTVRSGEIYALIDGMSGNLKEGETKETVKENLTESIRLVISDTGADPDEYLFDVYVYLYDDYDYSPEEFLDFVGDEILAHKTESANEAPSASARVGIGGGFLPLKTKIEDFL